jgi:hypothetical protein
MNAKPFRLAAAYYRNDRLVATLVTPYNPPEMTSLLDLGAARLSEIEYFFVSYNIRFETVPDTKSTRAMRSSR